MWETVSTPALSDSPTAGGRGYRFHVHARRFPLEDLPTDDDGLAKWLEQRWVEKGEWLDKKKEEWGAMENHGEDPSTKKEL
jgi:hypothetical protein